MIVMIQAHENIALIINGGFLPYRSANLGTMRQLTVHPAKYMDPMRPILKESTP
jgi:hypothetical protein